MKNHGSLVRLRISSLVHHAFLLMCIGPNALAARCGSRGLGNSWKLLIYASRDAISNK